MTHLFSQAEVPLVHETVPLLERLEQHLTDIIDDHGNTLPPVICVAAQAAILVLQKYYELCSECEIHRIAMGEFL
jgi:hypothetical protein